MWMFPAVMNASATNTAKREVNAPSTMSRKVGCREDPGMRIFARKDSSSEGEEDGVGVDMVQR